MFQIWVFINMNTAFNQIETWTPISAGNKPVVEDLFAGRWNTAQLAAR